MISAMRVSFGAAAWRRVRPGSTIGRCAAAQPSRIAATARGSAGAGQLKSVAPHQSEGGETGQCGDDDRRQYSTFGESAVDAPGVVVNDDQTGDSQGAGRDSGGQ